MKANEELIVKNAVTCTICGSPADRHGGAEFVTSDPSTWGRFYQCQANPFHIGDCFVGIFNDLTPPSDVEL